MKKTIALVLAFLMIFLCACSKTDDGKGETTASNSETSAVKEETTTVSNNVSEWNNDMIPADFPPAPAGTYNVKVSVLPAEDEHSGACFDITRVIFSCPENEFMNYANYLIGHGFFGGMKNIVNGTMFGNGYAGGWKNDKYLIVISGSNYEENGDLKISLDITENVSAFPEALKEFFPEFAFPARTRGTYLGYNSQEDQTNDFNGKIEHIYWQWHFRYDNAFMGVSQGDFESYIRKLEEAGFSGAMAMADVDGCDVINAEIAKDDFVILITYNQNLKTMDIIYSNHFDYFFSGRESDLE